MCPWGKLSLIVLVVSFGSSECKLIELNHEGLGPGAQYWVGGEPFILENKAKPRPDGLPYKSFKFSSPEHIGTHLDAPSHFSDHGQSVDEIPLQNLIGPVVVIDIKNKVRTNSIYQLTSQDVKDWVDTNGMFPNNSVVLVNTGWSKRYNNRESYFGHPTDKTKLVFPGVSESAAQTLIDYASSDDIFIVGIGIDTPSTDYSLSKLFEAHRVMANKNVYGLENLNNLDQVPTRGAEITVMPMKIVGGSGAPARVVVRVDEEGHYCNKSTTPDSILTLSITAIVMIFCNGGNRV